jgi:hypothetical protein
MGLAPDVPLNAGIVPIKISRLRVVPYCYASLTLRLIASGPAMGNLSPKTAIRKIIYSIR